MIDIRLFRDSDWPATWEIIEPVFRAGQTYVYPRDIDEEQARRVWTEIPLACYVAFDEDEGILGTYYLKPNQPGQGSHVCNCGYIVARHARGKGLATRMCEHSQQQALSRGFRAMQYNMVVSTNDRAISLWRKLGFHVVGTLPRAFHHPHQGYVDAVVMYKELVEPEKGRELPGN